MTAEFPLAVHALVYLLHCGETVSSGEIAKNICTNPARVRKVLSLLHKAGLVEAGRGKGSGYRALPSCGERTLLQLLDVLDQRVVELSWRPGEVDRDCLISSGMGAVMDGIYRDLDDCCRERLRLIRIADVSDRIFHP